MSRGGSSARGHPILKFSWASSITRQRSLRWQDFFSTESAAVRSTKALVHLDERQRQLRGTGLSGKLNFRLCCDEHCVSKSTGLLNGDGQ